MIFMKKRNKKQNQVTMPKLNSSTALKDVLTESMMSNAGYALNRIFKPDIIIIRLMWLSSLLLLSAFCSMSILKTITNYLQNEVVTKINSYNEIPSPFPSITICNLAPFDLSDWNNIKLVKNLTESLPFKYNFGTNTNSYRYYYMSNFFDKFNDSERLMFAYPKEAMIYLCVHDLTTRCDKTDFEWYYDFYYGNCFKFNPNEQIKSYKTGKISGIHMEIDVGDDYPLPWLSESGVHVFIHNKSHRISMYQGIDAPAGKSTNIAIKREFSNKLEKPYSDCVEDLEAYDSKYYRMMRNAKFAYQQSDCLELCFSEYVLKKCNCSEGSTLSFIPGSICKTTEQIDCLINTMRVYYDLQFENCNCPLECHSIAYTFAISLSEFPTYEYAEFYIKNIFGDFPHEDELNDYVSKTLLSLNIYYDDLKYTVIDEKIKTDWVDLAAAIGGKNFNCILYLLVNF
jgi:hypothetical protein